ncbi:MAG: hypothetical protein KAR20_15495, partial [Candidatus Heimdallarchaeota archaeon]|nr:hypothetical protein [Candidatus Heimdallarchaeota archaeon]
MGKKFFSLCASIVLILGFIAVPAFAADTDSIDTTKVEEPVKKVDTETTSDSNPDKFLGDESVNFFGTVNLRLYSFLYEGGQSPYNAYFTMLAQAGMSVDMGPVFWSLCHSTTSLDHSSYNGYGVGSSNYVPYYFLSDFSTYFKHVFAVWKPNEKMYFAIGRFDKTIDKAKKFMLGITPLTFHGDFAFDGFGVFPQLMKKDNMVLNAAFLISYLGKFLKGVAPDLDDTYSHFWLVGFQPQLHMKLSAMALTAWLGFWAITHPDNLSGNSTSATNY